MVVVVLTSALHSRGRSEGSPERFGAHLTAGGHVETDGHKLVALQHHRHDLVPVSVGQHWGSRVVVRLPGLSLSGVQNLGRQSGQVRSDNTLGVSIYLEYPRNVLSICPDDVTLSHGPHMENLNTGASQNCSQT